MISRDVLLELPSTRRRELGGSFVPSSLSRYRVSAYLYDGYWADGENIDTDTNIQLTHPHAPFHLQIRLFKDVEFGYPQRGHGSFSWQIDKYHQFHHRHPQHRARRESAVVLLGAEPTTSAKRTAMRAVQCRSASAPNRTRHRRQRGRHL